MDGTVPRGAGADRLRPLGCALVSGLAYPLVFPPFGWSALTWVVLVPLVIGLRRSDARNAMMVGACFGFVATLGVIRWVAATLHAYFGMSVGEIAGFLMGVGFASAVPYFAIAFWLYAWGSRVLPTWARPLSFAAAWVLTEYARTTLGLRSPWAKLGDAHAGALWLRQIADLTGVYGVSGLVALGNATIAEAGFVLWDSRLRSLRKAELVRMGAVFASLCGFVLAYGSQASMRAGEPTEGLDVAIVQGDVPSELRWRRATASKVVRRYLRLTREALRAPGAEDLDLIVWPENAIQTPLADPVYGAALRSLARVAPPILIGAPRFEGAGVAARSFNSVHLLQPDGSSEHYDKRRLLPFSEASVASWLPLLDRVGDLEPAGFSAGDRPGLFELADAKISVLICLEALYPDLAREAARAGATAIVNPSNDSWYRGRGGGEQHLQQTVFRAIETRIPIVRATTTGISAIIGPDGTVEARLEAGVSGVLRARLARASVRPTAYTRFGDVFALGCTAFCLLSAGRAWMLGRVPGLRRWERSTSNC